MIVPSGTGTTSAAMQVRATSCGKLQPKTVLSSISTFGGKNSSTPCWPVCIAQADEEHENNSILQSRLAV